MTTIDPSLGAFLATVSLLAPEQFDAIRVNGRRMGPARRIAARKAAKLSASEFSSLDKRVRDTIQRHDAELGRIGDGALTAAINDTLLAAHAVGYADRLSDEEYSVLVAPFVEAGVPVPPRQLRP
ncbi:hypothetical protein [Agromyces sp. Marseille-Q5079]|uniref:hypothetical protein n=1 Tax=Agromyces sp. Marseille-Q5079 TaxID=3439059 RepID=UPI003D9CA561